MFFIQTDALSKVADTLSDIVDSVPDDQNQVVANECGGFVYMYISC